MLLSIDTPILIDNWRVAVEEFLSVNRYKFLINCEPIEFEKNIKELENTFIETKKDSFDNVVVEYQNPSIQDFLFNYLKNKNDLIDCILGAAIYVSQYFTLFITKNENTQTDLKKIFLTEEQIAISVERIIDLKSKIKSSKIFRVVSEDKSFNWRIDSEYMYSFINNVYNAFAIINDRALVYVYQSIQDRIYMTDRSYTEQSAYIELLSKIEKEKLQFDEAKLVKNFTDKIYWVDNLELIEKLKELFPSETNKLISENNFSSKLENIIDKELKYSNDSDLAILKDQIEELEKNYKISFEKQMEEIEMREQAFEDYLSERSGESFDEDAYEDEKSSNLSEEQAIDEIFEALIR